MTTKPVDQMNHADVWKCFPHPPDATFSEYSCCLIRASDQAERWGWGKTPEEAEQQARRKT